MDILLTIAELCLFASLRVMAVRFLIVPGIAKASVALNFGSKARGKLLGYVTSVPELVIVISSAAAGVFDAGFWNIASSNIINWCLFLSAVFAFRQSPDLRHHTSVDEIAFGLFSVLLPLALLKYEIPTSASLAVVLLLVFVAYKALDRRLNPKVRGLEMNRGYRSKLLPALSAVAAGSIAIVVAGYNLGIVAKELVVELGVPAWMIGWILGIISSIPELSGFFEVYRKYKRAGALEGINDTQEALDTLVASNMSNLCVILPVGIFLVTLL